MYQLIAAVGSLTFSEEVWSHYESLSGLELTMLARLTSKPTESSWLRALSLSLLGLRSKSP